MKTVFIIDPDLGFVYWLGQALHQNGFEALLARNVSDVASLLSQLHVEIDVLIVNTALDGIAPLIEHLRVSQKEVKVIAVSADPEPTPFPGANATMAKPATLDELTKLDWVAFVRHVIEDAPEQSAEAG